MIRIRDTLAGDKITFYCVQSKEDLYRVADFIRSSTALGLDTESTGINCYAKGWKLRTVQCGNARRSYVIHAKWRKFIAWMMRQDVQWIGHNGPHDIRSIDAFLGYETGAQCAETYIPAHHLDSRNQQEGGTGHGLKELAMAHISRESGKWETELKRAFKDISIPIPGEVYKSGPRKGTQKYRKAKLTEGWGLIDPYHPAYIAYAAADPLLTYRLWGRLQPVFKEFTDLYRFDQRVAAAADRLQRRAMRLDVRYTKKLNRAFTRKAEAMMEVAASYGLDNIHSGQQVAECLLRYGARFTERTPGGQYVTDANVLRKLLKQAQEEIAADANESCIYREEIILAILVAKQLLKRRESYTEQFLAEMDSEGRIHPSINTLGARTTRMSVSKPPLQQLPTKDREDELANG